MSASVLFGSKMKKGENLTMEEEEEPVKWAKYYSSSHQILLVGEGDFSFPLSLADSFDSATNIVATSFDPRDVVIKKYSRAISNVGKLEKLGATILHGVDATKMKLHTDLKMRKFDRIIFNFPHAGFHGKEDEMHQIRLHRNLVRGFFKCASQMLRPYGEVHINHKTTKPFCCWKLEEIASNCYLGLLECVKFERTDYPGYQNKRGDGPRCDETFRLGECSTFKFGIMHSHQCKKQAKMGCMHEESFYDMPVTREGDLRIEPPVHHNSMQGIAEIQFGNPRISPRINELPASHTMPVQGVHTRQFTDPGISTRSNVLSAYHPLTMYKAPAMEHGNSQIFSRFDHAVSTSHPNAYKFVIQVVNPRTSNSNDRLPLQYGDLEDFRSSSHSLFSKQQDNDIRIFNRNYFHHAAAYMTKSRTKSIFEDYISHEDEMFGRIDNALTRRADNDFPGFAYEDTYGWRGRTAHGYRRYLEQPHHPSILRSASLGRMRPYPSYD